jgi:WD40 repeat protein
MATIPSKIIIACGTYEGVLAGWDMSGADGTLKLAFATPVHGGSVRSLAIAGRTGNTSAATPGSLLSCGYDEVLRTHDLHKRMTCSGEVRIPADFAFGTPVCSSFAPPTSVATHCLLGFTGGKLVIYKKRDWTVQHVLAGHEGGVASLAVHPSGKMALTAGTTDGKLKLWDLTKGRLAFVSKIPPASTNVAGRTHYDPVTSLVWGTSSGSNATSDTDIEADCYAFCHGSHATVKDVATGKDLLDVELPSKINEMCLMRGPEGLFLAAACNDGSLPVLAVQNVIDHDDDDDEDDDSSNNNNKETGERRAIMAIEPVDGPVAGEERFKCIKSISGYYVVTANSIGVISLMNLQGAVNMIMTPQNEDSEDDDDDDSKKDPEETPESDSDDDEEEELAVDIIDSVQLGSGARITCLAAWCYLGDDEDPSSDESSVQEEVESPLKEVAEDTRTYQRVQPGDKPGDRKRKHDDKEVTMDPEALARAKMLVSDAKKIQKRNERKKGKKQHTGR